MAIAAQDAVTGGASPQTKTITAGTNLGAVAFWFSLTGTTTMTANATPMTKIGQVSFAAGEVLSMFVLANPPTGSVTFTGAGATDNRGMVISSFTGVDQTNVVDNTGTSFASQAPGPSATASGTIANVVSSGCWMVGADTSVGGSASLSGVTGDFTTRVSGFLSSNGTIGTGSQSGGVAYSDASSTLVVFIGAIQPNTFVASPSTVIYPLVFN